MVANGDTGAFDGVDGEPHLLSNSPRQEAKLTVSVANRIITANN